MIDAVLSPPEIDLLPQRDLSHSLCVVFDVLRATSSMLTGLAHGTREIRPVLTIEEARETKAALWPDAILGGERHGDRIDGFDLGNSPLEYARPGLERIITTTTNGTVALRACAHAHTVFAGALLNMEALAEATRHTLADHPELKEVVLICAGTFRELGLEDVLAAGMLAARLEGRALSDSAQLALALYRQHEGDLHHALCQSANGRVLLSRGRGEEVAWCAKAGALDVVGIQREGVLTAL